MDVNDLLIIEQQLMDSERHESFHKEKQISIDPASLNPTKTTISPPKLKLVNSCSVPKKTTQRSTLSRQHSGMDDADLALQETVIRRSKSVGEGRSSAPADDFVLVLQKPPIHHGKERDVPDDGVKCSKLCMFLPRGKGKPVRSHASSSPSHNNDPAQIISRTVSLERFDCDLDDKNMFLDLPLELIRCSISDMQSPVRAAFLFDKEPKGVLKNYSSGSIKLKSQDSIKQVRFSTESPTAYPPTSSSSCVTPRLRKARDDFNAFLEAQT